MPVAKDLEVMEKTKAWLDYRWRCQYRRANFGRQRYKKTPHNPKAGGAQRRCKRGA
jgi:hypothetical protein